MKAEIQRQSLPILPGLFSQASHSAVATVNMSRCDAMALNGISSSFHFSMHRIYFLFEWTPDGHLRHSKFIALRDDKDVCVRSCGKLNLGGPSKALNPHSTPSAGFFRPIHPCLSTC